MSGNRRGFDLVSYFQKQLQQCEADLRYAETSPGFALRQRTDQGEIDITAQHIEGLRAARDEIQRMLADLTSDGRA